MKILLYSAIVILAAFETSAHAKFFSNTRGETVAVSGDSPETLPTYPERIVMSPSQEVLECAYKIKEKSHYNRLCS